MKRLIAIIIGSLFVLTACPDGKKEQVKDEKKLEEPKEPAEKKEPTIETGEVKVDTVKKEKKVK